MKHHYRLNCKKTIANLHKIIVKAFTAMYIQDMARSYYSLNNYKAKYHAVTIQ